MCYLYQVLEGKPIYADCFGNLVPLTKSGQHHLFSFYAFKENRLALFIKVSHRLFLLSVAAVHRIFMFFLRTTWSRFSNEQLANIDPLGFGRSETTLRSRVAACHS